LALNINVADANPSWLSTSSNSYSFVLLCAVDWNKTETMSVLAPWQSIPEGHIIWWNFDAFNCNWLSADEPILCVFTVQVIPLPVSSEFGATFVSLVVWFATCPVCVVERASAVNPGKVLLTNYGIIVTNPDGLANTWSQGLDFLVLSSVVNGSEMTSIRTRAVIGSLRPCGRS
jgi:hypothetical protein